MNCVIYIRVSSEDQVQGKSLESQLQDCQQYASAHGWKVVRVFNEPGESAKTADRPVFHEMISFCQQRRNAIGRIVFWKISRYMRNVKAGYHFLYELEQARCDIASATEPLPEGMPGVILLNGYMLQAQIENMIRSDTTKRVLLQLALQGYWVHQAPYGFRTARDAGGFPILEPDPVTGPLLAHVFNSIASGSMVPVTALKYLRERSVKGVRKGAPMALQSLHDMLRKEVYCGRIRNSYTAGRSVPARFEGLVSEDVFDRVQARLNGRDPCPIPRRLQREDFPLKGLVKCHSCGRPMTASWSKGRSQRYAYYSCQTGCAGHRICKEDLEKSFVEFLDMLTLRTSNRMRAFKEILLEEWKASHGEIDISRSMAKDKIASIQKQQTLLLDKLLNGTISDEDYKTRDLALRSERVTLAAHADAELPTVHQLEDVLTYSDRLLQNLSATWLSLSGQAKQWFQHGVFPAGISWSPIRGLGTVANNHLFSILETYAGTESGVAPPTGSTSNREDIGKFIRNVSKLKELVAA